MKTNVNEQPGKKKQNKTSNIKKSRKDAKVGESGFDFATMRCRLDGVVILVEGVLVYTLVHVWKCTKDLSEVGVRQRQ